MKINVMILRFDPGLSKTGDKYPRFEVMEAVSPDSFGRPLEIDLPAELKVEGANPEKLVGQNAELVINDLVQNNFGGMPSIRVKGRLVLGTKKAA